MSGVARAELYDYGMWPVLCDSEKRPLFPNWQKFRPMFEGMGLRRAVRGTVHELTERIVPRGRVFDGCRAPRVESTFAAALWERGDPCDEMAEKLKRPPIPTTADAFSLRCRR